MKQSNANDNPENRVGKNRQNRISNLTDKQTPKTRSKITAKNEYKQRSYTRQTMIWFYRKGIILCAEVSVYAA